MKVYIHFIDGFEEIEALTPVDVLRRAGIEVLMVSVTGKKMVTGSHNITIETDCLFEEADYAAADMLILPGGPGTGKLNEFEPLKKKVQEFSSLDKKIAAICAAPMILGQLGVLKGKKATCFPGYEKYLEGAEVTGRKVEIAGNIITSKGAGTAMDFSLAIVSQLISKEKADEVAAKMQCF